MVATQFSSHETGSWGGTKRSAGIPHRLVFCVVIGLTMLAACSVGEVADPQPILRKADVVGSWSSPKGGEITFSGDQQFTATDLRLRPYYGAGCQDLSVAGTWQFIGPQGDSGRSLTAYTSGNFISLNFVAPGRGPCAIGIELASWEVNPPLGLCLNLDPDSPCAGYVFVKSKVAGLAAF